MPVRPIIDRALRTPFVANEPLDNERLADVLPRQIQIAFVDHGGDRCEVVPVTPAARELLFGPHRDAARAFFTGVADAARGAGAIGPKGNLRGMTLSDSPSGFAVSTMLSNVEAGFVPDSIAAGDVAGFRRTFQGVADASAGARAQDTGWLDLGPKVSAHAMDLITHGVKQVPEPQLHELGLVLTHELQHAVTPAGPGIADRDVWLEEGIAETMTWWPGNARTTMQSVGAWRDGMREPDPYTVDPSLLPSPEYRMRHRAVQGLLGLAGIEPFRDDGSIDAGSAARARQLLQGDVVGSVPRDLARAIARRQGIAADAVPELAERISGIGAGKDGIDSLTAFVDASRHVD